MITTRNKLAFAALLMIAGSQMQAISPRGAKIWAGVVGVPFGAVGYALSEGGFVANIQHGQIKTSYGQLAVSLGVAGFAALITYLIADSYTPAFRFKHVKELMKQFESNRYDTEFVALIKQYKDNEQELVAQVARFWIDYKFPLIKAEKILVRFQASFSDMLQIIHEIKQEEEIDPRVAPLALMRFEESVREVKNNVRTALQIIKQSDEYKKELDDQERERKQRDQERMAWERVKAECDLAYAQQQNANATERLASTAHTSMSARQQQTPQVNIFGRRY